MVPLIEQKLKQKHPTVKKILWNSKEQNWSINFNELDKSHQAKTKKAQEKQEKAFGELEEGNE